MSVDSINRDGKTVRPYGSTRSGNAALQAQACHLGYAKLAASTGVADCIILDAFLRRAQAKGLRGVIPLNEAAVLVFGKFGTFPCKVVRSSPGEAGIKNLPIRPKRSRIDYLKFSPSEDN